MRERWREISCELLKNESGLYHEPDWPEEVQHTVRWLRDYGSLLSRNLLDADIAEHPHSGVIVELQAYRTGFRAGGIAGRLRHQLAVEGDANDVIARLDIKRIPVEIALDTVLRFRKQVDASGGVLVAIVRDLNFIADVRGSALGVPVLALGILRARGVTDRY